MAGQRGRRGLDSADLVRIARMYHLEGAKQPEIARSLKVSVATVSRALARAAANGIVQITIRDDQSALHDAEIALQRRYPGLVCRIAPTSAKPAVTLRSLADLAARHLERELEPGVLIGVSWGETLRGMGEALPDLRHLGVDTVPLLGAIGRIETGIWPNAIAQTFARALGGNAYIVNTPAVVDSPAAREALVSDSSFEAIRKLWARVDTALLGVSGVDPTASLSRSAALPPGLLARLRKAGVACATNFNFLRADGSPTARDVASRLLVLGIDQLRRIRRVILVAVGAEKSEPLRVALAAGIGNVLLTDEDAARGLLGRES